MTFLGVGRGEVEGGGAVQGGGLGVLMFQMG